AVGGPSLKSLFAKRGGYWPGDDNFFSWRMFLDFLPEKKSAIDPSVTAVADYRRLLRFKRTTGQRRALRVRDRTGALVALRNFWNQFNDCIGSPDSGSCIFSLGGKCFRDASPAARLSTHSLSGSGHSASRMGIPVKRLKHGNHPARVSARQSELAISRRS